MRLMCACIAHSLIAEGELNTLISKGILPLHGGLSNKLSYSTLYKYCCQIIMCYFLQEARVSEG